MMAGKLFPYALLLLSWVISSGAHADDFAERCAQLPQQAKIAVVFHDREVTTDNSHTVPELNRMSGKPAGDYHNVYGITHAKPSFRVQVAPRMLADHTRRICAIPDIPIELGFSEFVVYLPKELTHPCIQEIIRQPTQDNFITWKPQFSST